MFNYVTGLLLSFSVILLTIVSLDLEFINSSKISFGQISNFTDNNDISNGSSSSSNNNSSKIEIATTTSSKEKEKEKEEATATEDWLTYSNNKFKLKYPPVG